METSAAPEDGSLGQGERGGDQGEARTSERLVGRIAQDVVVTAGVWVVLGGFAGGVLSLAGLWQPLVGGTVLLALLALSWRVAHRLPVHPLPVWVGLLLALITLGMLVWAGTTHSEEVLPRRDPGSYLQSAIDLAEHHRRPIDVDPASVGGPQVLEIPGITLASPAFYAVGTPEGPAIQPQFMVGSSVWWSVAIWLGGVPLALWGPAVAMALGVLAVGLLAASTIGARWGPPAAALVALCFPIIHTARSTYSESLATLVLASGLLVLVAPARTPRRARWAGLVAGCLVGGGVVLRPDALRESMLLLLVAGLALVQRRPLARPLLAGTLVAATLAMGLGWVTSDQYLRSIGRSLVPLLAMTLVVVVGVLLVARSANRGRRLPERVRAWLPRVLPAVVVLAGVGLLSRPLWLTVHGSAASPGGRYVAALQRRQGLPVDPGRTYAEHSVEWMAWWVGPVTLGLALVALTILSRRAADAWVAGRPLPSWAGPLLVATGSAFLTLVRPRITPDHPWADRRLLVALALAVVLAVAALAEVARWRPRWDRTSAALGVTVAVTAVLGAMVALPTLLATAPHATERVESGELAATRTVCAATRPGDVVLAVDDRAANEWPQVLRGMCGTPALSTTGALRHDPAALSSAVARVAAGVEAHGGRLMLLAAETPHPLAAVGAQGIRQVVDTTVEEDPRLLEQRPEDLVDLPITVWLAASPAPAP